MVHNGGRQRISDLLDYVSLHRISVPFLREEEVPAEALAGAVELDMEQPEVSSAKVLRRRLRRSFWQEVREAVPASVLRLAGELHGTGMRPTSGLFEPSEKVLRLWRLMAPHLGQDYLAVHVRRGDKLVMPGLAEATCPAAVAGFVSRVAGQCRKVYVATNEEVENYEEALKDAGFLCYTARSLVSLDAFTELADDNYLLFAVEMKLVDEAKVSVRTFNDATPWFCSHSKVSHFLLDRSMHDYVLGLSGLGRSSRHFCNPLDFEALRFDALDAALPRRPTRSESCEVPRHVLVFEGWSTARSWRDVPASIWPMRRCADGSCQVEVSFWGPELPSPTSITTWTDYFGPLASFQDTLPSGPRRSTLFGFENVSPQHQGRRRAELPRATGAVFAYCSLGRVTVTDRKGRLELCAGQYGAFAAPLSLALAPATRLVAVHAEPFTALRSCGGPVEPKGRLRYVDGCSDTLLLAPPKLSDPCLNLLHFPAHISQTAHTHPSLRCGLIAGGAGYCQHPGGQLQLKPGMVWAIPAETVHSFHTKAQELNVIAYHPDTDWGPQDEDHPMLNRTWVDGRKIDNSKHGADMLCTEQSLVEALRAQTNGKDQKGVLGPLTTNSDDRNGTTTNGAKRWVQALAVLEDQTPLLLQPAPSPDESVASVSKTGQPVMELAADGPRQVRLHKGQLTVSKVYSPLHSKLKAHLAKPYAASVARKLLDEDWRVRLAAVVALGDLKASFAEQVGALCRDPDNQVRRSALAALEKMGAAPALAAGFLGDDDAAVRKDAATVYAALGGGQMDDGELSEAD
ncbi:unnamed protein product [Effrenium voratum]|uniref:AraC-type arabinose-binding/dimerisation domain-containing protein n=1 Tax=Effrenium voratum TaxID=2562239 RepID=A0AA36HLU6_9DINO|nr:unnamed protein product [Effrenium voratum]